MRRMRLSKAANLLEHVRSKAEWFPPQFEHLGIESLFGQSLRMCPLREQVAQVGTVSEHFAAG